MAAINSLSARNDQRLPLHKFLLQAQLSPAGEPGRRVLPLIRCLADIHAEGKAHGAVCATRLLCQPNGELDVSLFRHRIASVEPLNHVEAYYGYPEGQGDTMEEQQRRDKQALANVLHLLMLGYEAPPPPFRATCKLRGNVADGSGWPAGFVALVEHMLILSAHDLAPDLESLISALNLPPPTLSLQKTEPPAETAEAFAPDVEVEATPEHAPPPSVSEVIEKDVENAGQALEAIPDADAIPPEVSAAPVDETTPAEPAAEPVVAETAAVTPPDFPFPPPLPSPQVRLPNGTVGREYSVNVLEKVQIEALAFASIELVSELPAGLKFEGDTISGSPTQAGEHEVHVHCIIQSSTPGRPDMFPRTLQITVNPDPQSLWKNLPSDQSEPFWKDDKATAALENSPMTVVAASLRGRSHAHVGSCRDDDFSISWHAETGWYVLVAADGAGSAKFSREGSRIACTQVREHFANAFRGIASDPITKAVLDYESAAGSAETTQTLRSILYGQFGKAAFDARKAIEDQANALQATLRDFHTTLIITLAKPLPSGKWFVAAFSVGDGAAALVGVPGGEPCLLTQPDGGEFAGQTVFLTMKEALATGESIMKRIKHAVVPQFDSLILVTDGISDPKFNSETSLGDPESWNALWSETRPLIQDAASRPDAAARLLQWMNFFSPGHHDDRTTVVLCDLNPHSQP